MISTQIFLPVVEGLRVVGFRAGPILESLDVDSKLLSNVDETVALEKYISFFEAAADITNNPYFGVDAGRVINPDSLGALGFLFASAPTLKDALNGLASYLGALQEGTHMRLDTSGEHVRYEYQILDDKIAPRRQDSEYSMAATVSLISRYVGRQFKPIEVSFEHARVGSHSYYENLFDCHVFFSQGTNYVMFERGALSLGAPSISKKLYPIISGHLQQVISSKNIITTFRDQVDALISPDLLENGVTMGKIASKLNISESTLARRLRAENSSFNDILNAKKMAVAKRLLAHSGNSINQVAMRVGYAENASFTRAFKALTGTTPDKYRKSLGPQ